MKKIYIAPVARIHTISARCQTIQMSTAAASSSYGSVGIDNSDVREEDNNLWGEEW